MSAGPLAGVRVLDFSTLLPGPFATLMLAEAGADVIKVERPGGEPMRESEADFALLNSGKRSVFADLKDERDRARVLALAATTDVVVEQFRPGVMDRLGLGAAALQAINPRLIFCSINGYGSHGPDAQRAGHDLTYAAESGMMMLSAGADGAPTMPTVLLGDIGGGTYPAVLNILLALIERARTGRGSTIEVAMADGIQPFLYPAYASAYGRGHWPRPNDLLETGSSARYSLYRAGDGRWIAVAAVEEKFWRAFCDAIERPELIEAPDDDTLRSALASRLAEMPADDWMKRFAAADTVCAKVLTFQEAMAARDEGTPSTPPPLPTPVSACFQHGLKAVLPPVSEAVETIDWLSPPGATS